MIEGTEPQVIASCKVTYFIGKLLAKAGILELRSDGLTFVPTALDRAMGAIDIPIPLDDIEGFYFNDTLQKNLQIKTPSRTHRFVGGGLNEIHENLIILKRKSLPRVSEQPQAPAAPVTQIPRPADVCFNCSKQIKPSFKFCPYCRSQMKLICHNCKEEVEQDWLSCPHCNFELKKA